MTNPYLEVLGGREQAAEGMIIPVHPACEKVSPAWMRRLVGNALAACTGMYDPLPLELRAKYRLMSRQRALMSIPFPSERRRGCRSATPSRVRRAPASRDHAHDPRSARTGAGLHADGARRRWPARSGACRRASFRAHRRAKAAARDEILGQLADPRAANHLLLGDVGTGKTVVAAFALAAAADNGIREALFVGADRGARAPARRRSPGPLLDAAGISWESADGVHACFRARSPRGADGCRRSGCHDRDARPS